MTMEIALPYDGRASQASRSSQVMIVEDDDDLRGTVAQLLEASGFAVDAFCSATEALSQLHRGMRPDVILLDLWMPEMNGWQFRIAQKRERSAADALVVAWSADRS